MATPLDLKPDEIDEKAQKVSKSAILLNKMAQNAQFWSPFSKMSFLSSGKQKSLEMSPGPMMQTMNDYMCLRKIIVYPALLPYLPK